MKNCLIAALSLALIACAGSSPRIDPARLNELQKGQTTVADVVRQFGRPSVLSRNPGGTQTAIYLQSDGQSGTTTMVPLVSTVPVNSVTFYFDTNGVLTDYKTTQANANKPALTDGARTTQAGSDKPAQPITANTTPADPGKTTQTDTSKATPGNASTWSFPSILIPSATKENR